MYILRILNIKHVLLVNINTFKKLLNLNFINLDNKDELIKGMAENLPSEYDELEECTEIMDL